VAASAQETSDLVVGSVRDESQVAREAPDLIVGSVRDESGAPLAGASVTLLDSAGHEIGSGVVDGHGTFAARPNGDPSSLRVRCAHCAPLQLALDDRTVLTIVVRRYDALERLVPSIADLAALPYGRVADALALTPFVLPSADGTSVSDRGLDGGRGLIADDGAPVYGYTGGPAAASISIPSPRATAPHRSTAAPLRHWRSNPRLRSFIRRTASRAMLGRLPAGPTSM
jgi:hypothetical protein